MRPRFRFISLFSSTEDHSNPLQQTITMALSRFNFNDVAASMQDFEKGLPKSYNLEDLEAPLFSPSVSTPERKKKSNRMGFGKSPFTLSPTVSPKFSPNYNPKTPVRERQISDSPPLFTPVNKNNKWLGSPLAYRLMSCSPKMFASRLNKENISSLTDKLKPFASRFEPSTPKMALARQNLYEKSSPLADKLKPFIHNIEPSTPRMSLATSDVFGSPSSMLPSSPSSQFASSSDTMPRLSLPPNFSGMAVTSKFFTPNPMRNTTVAPSTLFKRPGFNKKPPGKSSENSKPVCDICKERQQQGQDKLTILRSYWKIPCSEKAYFHLPCF